MNQSTIEIFKQIEEDLLNLVLLKFDVQYFYEAPQDIKSVVFNRYFLIQRIQIVTVRTLVVGLSRLLNHSEDYSYFSLMKELRKDGEFKDSLTEINDIGRALNKLVKSQDYKKIKNLRNKYYAHLDFNRKVADVSISYREIVDFLDPIEKLHNRFKMLIEESEMYFNFSSIDKGHNLYECAMINHNLWDLYEKRKLEQTKMIPTEDIERILFSGNKKLN